MRFEDFDYTLPRELIAQYPARRRADSRMLVVHRSEQRYEDATFHDLPRFLSPGTVLALNNSRVLPARLFGYRQGVKSQPISPRNPARAEYLSSPIEVLLARQLDERRWEALVKPGRKVRIGERLIFPPENHSKPERSRVPKAKLHTPPLEAEVIGRGEYGMRILEFPDATNPSNSPANSRATSLAKMLERVGHIPLPPYIRRADDRKDRLRYQTVYAQRPGSVAAPTAGLHFTRPMLREIEDRGVERVEVTLHVGLGTFQPIHETDIQAHRMHPETFEIDPRAAESLNRALDEQRQIVAVGTTTVRVLEHASAAHGGRINAECGETRLFILPGFRFQVIGGLLTNFHLPRTTLLMQVSAFAGRELILSAYEHAVRERYRFYSYGDCMLIL